MFFLLNFEPSNYNYSYICNAFLHKILCVMCITPFLSIHKG
nr:MAG TPA: hypothetical protein [Caudoviricetes sp.]